MRKKLAFVFIASGVGLVGCIRANTPSGLALASVEGQKGRAFIGPSLRVTIVSPVDLAKFAYENEYSVSSRAAPCSGAYKDGSLATFDLRDSKGLVQPFPYKPPANAEADGKGHVYSVTIESAIFKLSPLGWHFVPFNLGGGDYNLCINIIGGNEGFGYRSNVIVVSRALMNIAFGKQFKRTEEGMGR